MLFLRWEGGSEVDEHAPLESRSAWRGQRSENVRCAECSFSSDGRITELPARQPWWITAFSAPWCHQCMWAGVAQKRSSPLEVQVEHTNGRTVPLRTAPEYLWNLHILSFRCLERMILFTSFYLSIFSLLKCFRFSNNILLWAKAFYRNLAHVWAY